MGKSRKGSNDIVFAGSKKAKLFNSEGIEDKSIEAVGGINGVLGARFKKAGVCTAKDLSCKMREMTKRNYLRYMMKESGSNVRYAMDSYVSLKTHCEKMKDYTLPSRQNRREQDIQILYRHDRVDENKIPRYSTVTTESTRTRYPDTLPSRQNRREQDIQILYRHNRVDENKIPRYSTVTTESTRTRYPDTLPSRQSRREQDTQILYRHDRIDENNANELSDGF
ncbi:hypothetical protein LSAT2_006573 [Lamellibrachia satsuma]|nr:hypothetical protein LSAT2_006573 [Lamellibrachia satsuma]